MEALRICKKPENGILTISLPESLAKSKELEIIIIPIDQVDQENQKDKKPFSPADYFGIWRHKNIDADKVSKELRQEWERNIL